MTQCHEEFKIPSPSAFYKPLLKDEIRLLRIDQNNDPIILSQLVHVPLFHEPAFWALSYTWGVNTNMEKILVNGSAIGVTINLYDALMHIRKLLKKDNNSVKYLWVDAICLNQADKREKSIEVPRMQLIYSRSELVIAWLGLENSEQEKNVKQLVMKMNSLNKLAERSKRPISAIISAYSNSKSGPMSNEHRQLDATLKDIGTRAWFKRIWVVQETALASRDPVMILGPHLFSFETYFGLRKALGSRNLDEQSISLNYQTQCHSLVRTSYHHVSNVDGLVSEEQTRRECARKMLELLFYTSGLEASVPHDYIYGLLGLIREPRLPYELIPQYNAAFEDVYHMCTKYILKQTMNPAILMLGRLGNMRGAPSWVPDFRHRNPSIKGHDGQTANFTITESSILTIRLGMLGICVSSSSIHTYDEFMAAPRRAIMHWDQTVFTESARIKGVSNIIIAEEWLSAHLSRNNTAHLLPHSIEAYKDIIRDSDSSHEISPRNETLSEQTKLLSALFCSQLFVLENGSIGHIQSSSHAIQKGDLICLIPHIPHPIVLHFVGADQQVRSFTEMWFDPDPVDHRWFYGYANDDLDETLEWDESFASEQNFEAAMRTQIDNSDRVYNHQHRIIGQAVIDAHGAYRSYHGSWWRPDDDADSMNFLDERVFHIV
ncbi:heterokaryon incompatibility protein-domain-containing protein [Phaeosphaeriaceae sp. PMI808]|nr:heterokaryon incompatibility protein-domain-containing protein [Phaeosphaeriaceae sp. PMI808]